MNFRCILILLSGVLPGVPVAYADVPTSPLVKRVVEGPVGGYFTYPHSNGFMPDGHTLVIAKPDGRRTEFIMFDPESGATASVGSSDQVKMYYGVSRSGMLVTNANNSLVVMSLADGSSSARVLWKSTAPWRLSDLPDISADGLTVITDFHDYTAPGRHQIRRFQVDAERAGEGSVLLEKPWLLNHAHRSPAAPEWVMFSHEGQRVTDRMWVWNETNAPEGHPIFDQIAPDGLPLFVGHEIAMHHKPAALAVAFGNSPGAPRGLYEIDFDAAGEKPRPVSEGNRDWHCNISSDGRWAVVDTMGRSDDKSPIQPGWADQGGVSDVVAVNLATGARLFLHRGSFLRAHPWHPHPHISPDGRWVVYNDADSHRVRALEIDSVALEAFLGDPTLPPKLPLMSPPPPSTPSPWDMSQLGRPPVTFAVPEAEVPPVEGLRSVYFEGPSFQGKPVRVFAYIGLPAGASVANKVPGIVLVHGSGGTAVADWVKLWTSRGYAAIAFDHNGGLPVGKFQAWKRNPLGGPSRNDIDFLDRPLSDQWMYHAVADTILANSLLGSLPEVDADRIGITGISLGGMITATVAGIDHRLKFAAPVYGCGHLADEVEDGSRYIGGKGTVEQRARWRELWDPANYLPRAPASLPFLWLNGTNDFAFALRSWQLSTQDAPGPRWLSLRVRMPHGQKPGESPAEIRAFADSVLLGGKPLVRLAAPLREANVVTVACSTDVPLVSAVLNYTCDTGRWQDRKWESLPASVKNGLVRVELPAGVTVYYISVIDERGLIVSTAYEALDLESK